MICIQLNGGLGNQMYQYSVGRAMAYKLQTELLLDTTQFKKKRLTEGYNYRSYELGIFNIKAREATADDIKKLKPLFYRIANGLTMRMGLRGIQSSRYLIEKGYSYNESIETIDKDCFLAGYWQSFRYFQSIESLVRKDFEFPQVLDKENVQRINMIKSENSISLHIRRTDFVNNIHGTCSIEYYKKAAECFANMVNSPYYFIFSDDIGWVQKNLQLAYPHEFVTGHEGKQSYIDMQLMSLCKHNIIANSSFSWWGAWLNSNPDKVVIAPKEWFAVKTMNKQTKDLIPEEWIKL